MFRYPFVFTSYLVFWLFCCFWRDFGFGYFVYLFADICVLGIMFGLTVVLVMLTCLCKICLVVLGCLICVLVRGILVGLVGDLLLFVALCFAYLVLCCFCWLGLDVLVVGIIWFSVLFSFIRLIAALDLVCLLYCIFGLLVWLDRGWVLMIIRLFLNFVMFIRLVAIVCRLWWFNLFVCYVLAY